MVTDTIVTDKKLRDSDEVVQRLIDLRDAYWDKRDTLSMYEMQLIFKINSCLYEKKES